jgi:hypothetical protein
MERPSKCNQNNWNNKICGCMLTYVPSLIRHRIDCEHQVTKNKHATKFKNVLETVI